MPTPTTERAERIKRAQIYGLFDGPVLIYVGITRLPLSRRLSFHKNDVRQGKDTPLHTYLRRVQEEGREKDITIRPLDSYDTEREAIEAHQDGILNTKQGLETPPPWTGYDWREDEAAQIGTAPDQVVADRLGIDWRRVRDAREKLGIAKDHRCRLDAKTVYALRVRAQTDPDYTHTAAARELGVSHSAVSAAVRGKTWRHVPFPDDDLGPEA